MSDRIDDPTTKERDVIDVDDSDGEDEAAPNGKNGENDRDEATWKDADFLSFGADDDDDGNEDDDEAENDDDVAEEKGAVVGRGDERGSTMPNVPLMYAGVADEPLPPWMDRHHVVTGFRRVPPLVALHNEIVDFTNLMMPREEEMKERKVLVERVTKLAHSTFGKDKCEVHIFGSYATGLVLPTSDIDLVISFAKSKAKEETDKAAEGEDGTKEAAWSKEKREMDEWNAKSGTPLEILAEALRDDWKSELAYLEVVAETRIPIVKFTHGPTGISLDVCFDQETGPKAAELMKNYLDAMPPLRPLTFVLKYFTAARGTNEPYSGGIGSFMLQMMIVSFLQHRERDSYNHRRESLMNLGALLVEFLELYGVEFNYVTTGISVRHDGFYFPKGAKDRKENFWQPSRPFSLALENPLEPTSDVGRATYRMQMIQRSFEIAYHLLLSRVSEPFVPAASILASILPPTEEMERRATMQKVLRIEREASRGSSSGYDIPPLKAARGGGRGGNKRRRRSSDDSEMHISSGEEDGQRDANSGDGKRGRDGRRGSSSRRRGSGSRRGKGGRSGGRR